MANFKWSHRGQYRVKGNGEILLLVEKKNTCCTVMTNTKNTAWFILTLMDIFAQVDRHFSLLDNYGKGNLMQNPVQTNCKINLFKVQLQVMQVPQHKHICIQPKSP